VEGVSDTNPKRQRGTAFSLADASGSYRTNRTHTEERNFKKGVTGIPLLELKGKERITADEIPIIRGDAE
jgi:hypothetical protein